MSSLQWHGAGQGDPHGLAHCWHRLVRPRAVKQKPNTDGGVGARACAAEALSVSQRSAKTLRVAFLAHTPASRLYSVSGFAQKPLRPLVRPALLLSPMGVAPVFRTFVYQGESALPVEPGVMRSSGTRAILWTNPRQSLISSSVRLAKASLRSLGSCCSAFSKFVSNFSGV